MQIAYMMGTSTASALEAIYGDPKKKTEADTSSVTGGSYDKVSISTEALELAARMNTADNAEAEQEQTSADQGAEEGLAQSGGVSTGGGAGDRAAEIESKITELQQKISDVQNSAVPEESKQAAIAGLQAQIDSLLQELNAMKA